MRPGAVAFRNKQKLKEKHKPVKSILKKGQPLKSLIGTAGPKKGIDQPYSKSQEETPRMPAVSPSIQLQRPGKDHKRVTFNPLLLSLPTDFREMDCLDQQLFIFQQGELMGSDTLRMSWPEAIEKLREAELLTIGQLQRWGGTKAIKARYRQIYDVVNETFGMEQQTVSENKENIYMRAESNQVLVQKQGTRYWKHHGDSIVDGKALPIFEESSPETQPQDNPTRTDSPAAEDIVSLGQGDNSGDTPCLAPHMAQAVKRDGGQEADDEQAPAVGIDDTDAVFHGYTLPDSTEASPSPFGDQFETQFEAIMDASSCGREIEGKFEQAAIRQSAEPVPSLSSPIGINMPFPGRKGERKHQKKGKRDMTNLNIHEDTLRPQTTERSTARPQSSVAFGQLFTPQKTGSTLAADIVEVAEQHGNSRVISYHTRENDPAYQPQLPTRLELQAPTTIDPRELRFMAVNARTGAVSSISDMT